ncbi:MAG: alkaline phosphatase [Planctomycetaceae bacterium]|nr:alkaline phosphatase [Planctomycetaceae bacterium]
MHRLILRLALALSLASACTASQASPPAAAEGGSVIFIHPDGTGLAHWGLARVAHVGPDGALVWDRLPEIGIYRPHMRDSLAPSSHSGATVHAYGVKVPQDSFGMDGSEIPMSAGGERLSVMREAMRAGRAVGIVNSGHLAEPGTAVFLASSPKRTDYAGICAKLLVDRPNVILGGGEAFFLPKGAAGRHGPGLREDGRNLVDEARAAGYTVVFTREELVAVPDGTTHLLGLFASLNTYNDRDEERLRAAGLPLYAPGAPTVAEMERAALRILERNASGFLLVVEEEGSDNFSNCHNAAGLLEAMRRADEAIAAAEEFRARRPETLVIVAADSSASGPQLVAVPEKDGAIVAGKPLPTTLPNDPAPLDGVDGRNTVPFVAKPDRSGRTLPFAVTWASLEDAGDPVVIRAAGPNSALLRGTVDNTGIYRAIRATLFGSSPATAP